MLRRLDVTHEKQIRLPGKFRRILRAADQEALQGTAPGRFEEKRFERRLPVGGVRSKVREICRDPSRSSVAATPSAQNEVTSPTSASASSRWASGAASAHAAYKRNRPPGISK